MRTVLYSLALATAALGCGDGKSKPTEPPAPPPPVGQPITAGSADGSSTGSTAGSAETVKPPPAPLPPLAADKGAMLGAPLWSTSVGGELVDVGRAVGVAPDGTVYAVGDFEGTATFGAAGDKAAAGKSDAVLVRLDTSGNVAAAWPLGGPEQEKGETVAVDADGNVVFGGLFAGTAKLGELTATANGSDDGYVAGVDAKGNPQWLWTVGGRSSDSVSALAAVPGGGWIVSVSFAETLSVGGVQLTSRGNNDVALIKLNKDGDVQWVTQVGGEAFDVINRVALDGNGGIYLLGGFNDVTDLGGGPLKSAGARDLIVARLDASGRHVWSKRIGGAFNDTPGGIAVDPSGNIVITGSLEKEVDFLGTKVVGKSEDIFVAKLAGDGALTWVKTYGADRDDAGFGVAVDAAGVIAVTGWFSDKVDFGGGALETKGYHDAFVLRLGPDGAYRGAVRFGGQDYDEGRAIALTRDGATVASGLYRYTNDLGPGKPVARQAPGTRFAKPDLFIVELAP